VAPKNNDDEQALGDQLLAALGLPIRGHWSTRKPKLMGHLHQYGTEFLIVDDAHDLSLEHLMLLKEVTDQGKLQYDHPSGVCLVQQGVGTRFPMPGNIRFA
jgi:type II secretory pathway predicted ATPase ExeA